MVHPSRIIRILPGLLLLAALAAAPVTAQTILLAVRDSVNGAPLAPPLPTREGVAGSLFDTGFIVFDAPGEAERSAAELAGLARTAGADLVLDVRGQYTDRALGAGGLRRVALTVTFTLTDAASGVVRAKGEETADNANREKDVDRVVLGQEIGRAVSARISAALKAGSR
jgi:hypothetical protein